MNKMYHILNGDSLMLQFPKEIEGAVIVFRECLVDGPVFSEHESFYDIRAQFISSTYQEHTPQDYYQKSAFEIDKITAIPNKTEVNLWFEDDLFCQVNFWYVVSLLASKDCAIFLVRPKTLTQYGFAAYQQDELIQLLKNKVPVNFKNEIAMLWNYYQNDDLKNLLKTAEQLTDSTFILKAVNAHIKRLPTQTSLGGPKNSLLQIMDDLNTIEFKLVFKEFCKREAIYGFGDLQVKRIYDQIMNAKN